MSPERRGDQVRARVTFEENKAGAATARGSATGSAAATAPPDWLPLYPGSKPEGVSVTVDPETGKRVGSYFFRTPDEISQVHDFYEDNMTRATWSVSRAPTQVWGSSQAEGRKFDVSPERRGDQVRARVTFEENKAGAPTARGSATGSAVADGPARLAPALSGE